VVQTTV